jgi:hypothetical protein
VQWGGWDGAAASLPRPRGRRHEGEEERSGGWGAGGGRGLSGWEGPRSDQGRSSAEDEGEGKPERQHDGEELCCRGSAKSHSRRTLGRAEGGTGTTLPGRRMRAQGDISFQRLRSPPGRGVSAVVRDSDVDHASESWTLEGKLRSTVKF